MYKSRVNQSFRILLEKCDNHGNVSISEIFFNDQNYYYHLNVKLFVSLRIVLNLKHCLHAHNKVYY